MDRRWDSDGFTGEGDGITNEAFDDVWSISDSWSNLTTEKKYYEINPLKNNVGESFKNLLIYKQFYFLSDASFKRSKISPTYKLI